MDWSVRIEVATGGRGHGLAEAVRASLGEAALIMLDPTGLRVRFPVRARTPHEAFAAGFELLRQSLPLRDGICRVEVEILDVRDSASASEPELFGIAELASLLRVSKQRASELAKTREFPRPDSYLKSGPVWRRSTIMRYVDGWSRRPGRPRKTSAEFDRRLLTA